MGLDDYLSIGHRGFSDGKIGLSKCERQSVTVLTMLLGKALNNCQHLPFHCTRGGRLPVMQAEQARKYSLVYLWGLNP